MYDSKRVPPVGVFLVTGGGEYGVGGLKCCMGICGMDGPSDTTRWLLRRRIVVWR